MYFKKLFCSFFCGLLALSAYSNEKPKTYDCKLRIIEGKSKALIEFETSAKDSGVLRQEHRLENGKKIYLSWNMFVPGSYHLITHDESMIDFQRAHRENQVFSIDVYFKQISHEIKIISPFNASELNGVSHVVVRPKIDMPGRGLRQYSNMMLSCKARGV